jgi:hypothetical protein
VTVTLETCIPCPCGYRIRAIMTATVRVNKRSMRTTGPMLGFIEHTRCPQCGAEVQRGEMEREPYRLAEEDAVKVAEYRKRRWGVESDGVAVERMVPSETAATEEAG